SSVASRQAVSALSGWWTGMSARRVGFVYDTRHSFRTRAHEQYAAFPSRPRLGRPVRRGPRPAARPGIAAASAHAVRAAAAFSHHAGRRHRADLAVLGPGHGVA